MVKRLDPGQPWFPERPDDLVRCRYHLGNDFPNGFVCIALAKRRFALFDEAFNLKHWKHLRSVSAMDGHFPNAPETDAMVPGRLVPRKAIRSPAGSIRRRISANGSRAATRRKTPCRVHSVWMVPSG